MIGAAIGAGFGSKRVNQVQSRKRQINLQKQQTPDRGQDRQRFSARPPDTLMNSGGDQKYSQRQENALVSQVNSSKEEDGQAQAGGAEDEGQRLLLLPVEWNRQAAHEQQAGAPR